MFEWFSWKFIRIESSVDSVEMAMIVTTTSLRQTSSTFAMGICHYTICTAHVKQCSEVYARDHAIGGKT